MSDLVAPFPYYGGKRRHTQAIWQALGDPQAYVEPFCGSAAVLLARPESAQPRRRELVNDIDCWVTNFWRAVQTEPETVAAAARWPINELDLAARQTAFTSDASDRMRTDPDYYDPRLAGWWAWGMSCSISGMYPDGWHGSLPYCKGYRGANQRHVDLGEWCSRLAARLTHVQVVCGDWERALSPALHMHGTHPVGVFLDPPYVAETRNRHYIEGGIAADVAEWAHTAGEDTRYRIALCGNPDDHDMPDGWRYQTLGDVGKIESNEEGMWLSPGCLKPPQGTLFG